MDDKKLSDLIRRAFMPTEPSRSFDQTFWQKIAERKAEPFAARVWRSVSGLLPAPSLAPVFAAAFLAFVLGGTAGVMNEIRSPGPVSAASRTLSGFSEYRGVPSLSLAGSYLNMQTGGGQS